MFLQFKFKFDATQARLNPFGLPSSIPAGNAAQTPVFHEMSVHYIELAPGALTPLGAGAIVYHAAETSKGGNGQLDFYADGLTPSEQILDMGLRGLAPNLE